MTGTEEAWTALRGSLEAFFRRRVRDAHLAEDLVQDTFVRVHDGLHGLEHEDRLAAWVWRVARNVLADHRRATPGPEPLIEDPGQGTADAHQNLNAEVESWLRAMISELPQEQRLAVELAELGGLPQHEVARRLGLSTSGAKSRVQRGRRRLRSLLSECCHLDFDRRGNVVGYQQRRGCSGC